MGEPYDGLYENRLFEGIPELLARLRGQGRRLYIATSKPTPFAREIARRFGDRRHDLIGARANGVQAVAVGYGYGYGSQAELSAEVPAYHFRTLAELRAAFG
jgi:phosphoglycolate phosphatase